MRGRTIDAVGLVESDHNEEACPIPVAEVRDHRRYFCLSSQFWDLRLGGGLVGFCLVKELTKKLRECAETLHAKAERLDDAHRYEQIIEIAEDLKAHSREIEQLAEQIRGRVDD